MTKPQIVVEDDRTGISPETLRRAVLDHLHYTRSKELDSATRLDGYFALSHTAWDRLTRRWMATQRQYRTEDPKRVYYLSAEFLLGRALRNNLLNLGLLELARDGVKTFGLDLDELLEEEPDPGLGNGGLGRLAACFLDSMATLGIAGYGYGIRYEFGIFRQEILEGRQIEHPDEWLRYGNPWEVARPEYTVPVHFGGEVVNTTSQAGRYEPRWVPAETVLAVPYDTPIAGYGTDTVNSLRLWSARAGEEFDLEVFNDGDYRRAVEQKALSESISKVLYPRDDTWEGKSLRLKQQYFFVASSLADIIRRFKTKNQDWNTLPDKAAIQLNDTHPSLAIPELMRILIDEEGVGWDQAWAITQRTIAYTNHTLLPEALERWPLELMASLLPRHLQIIQEIDRRFRQVVHVWAAQNQAVIDRMAIVDRGPKPSVRMGHLCVVGSNTINGVAELHGQLLKDQLFKDFNALWPERFQSKTNGVTPRRWLLSCNPSLSEVITRRIGPGWCRDLSAMEGLAQHADDESLHAELFAVKRANKASLAQHLLPFTRELLDPDHLFDTQIKRIHEYKRQLLLALFVVAEYRRLKFDREADVVPRTVIFGGKAAPGYAKAKLHIRLINDIAAIINQDRAVNQRLRVLFVPNYGVSLAERIIPATDLSEQISTAGYEASGTGCMKFQMNGALTIGTLDGANVEIRDAVGHDEFFLFGLNADEVAAAKAKGHRPEPFIRQSPTLAGALELLDGGFFSPEEKTRYQGLVAELTRVDPYLVCADFDGYVEAHRAVGARWRDRRGWMRSVVLNLAHCGKFSSDRTITEYNRDIWRAPIVKVVAQDPQ